MMALLTSIMLAVAVIGIGYRLGIYPILEILYRRRLEDLSQELAEQLSSTDHRIRPAVGAAIVTSPLLVATKLPEISLFGILFEPLFDRMEPKAVASARRRYNPFRHVPKEVKELGDQMDRMVVEWVILRSPLVLGIFVAFFIIPEAVQRICRMISDESRRRFGKNPLVAGFARAIPASLQERTTPFLDGHVFGPARNSYRPLAA